ncbi:ERCC4 domain-containing protein [Planctomycetota bacterium]
MTVGLSSITISATKPDGKIARGLEELGIRLIPIKEDEGDVDRYVVSKCLCIDRRNGSAFLKGIMEKTLFTSAIYIREHFKIPVLIVEGKVNYEYSMMNPQAIRGALSSMMLEYGLNVLCTADPEETVHLIAMMARQDQLGIPEISLIPKRKAPDLPDLQRRVIEMLPGCGRVMAKELLQHFGSVVRIAAATEKELLKVPGIGAKKAKEMVKVLSAVYEAVDTEKQIEAAIEADPKLLFKHKVELLTRQHTIFTEGKDKHVVDMVFHSAQRNELYLVELKRGRLGPAHHKQLCRYLDNAGESKLIRPYLDKGVDLVGILASVESSDLKTNRPNIKVRQVDGKKVMAFLKKRRRGV